MIQEVGKGKVVLVAGGGHIYTDMAARFCKSEKDIEYIINQPYKPEIVENVIKSGHEAMLEFDHFIFAVEGYSRVCEIQLVRKRHASYSIKSGRVDKNGKREFSTVLPKSIEDVRTPPLDILDGIGLGTYDIINIIEAWYNEGIKQGIPEEDLRYLKPQATEFKGFISMNAHALRDWFKIRMCNRAQFEIRDMAIKMYKLCMEATPDLFKDAGMHCKVLGYCPEGNMQCSQFKDKIPTKEEALKIIRKHYKEDK